MIEREKVIEWADKCTSPAHKSEDCNGCPYHSYHEGFYSCIECLMMDAVELLEEQEPILLENQHKPYGISTNANSPWISRCPKCGKKVEGKQTRFCKYCGQAVRWE